MTENCELCGHKKSIHDYKGTECSIVKCKCKGVTNEKPNPTA